MNQSNSVDANTDSREADSRSTGNYDYSVREAVGVFADPAALERAVDELEIAGFDRAALSVFATDETIIDRVGHLYRNVAEVEDNRHVPQAAFAEVDSRVEGEAAAVGILFYIAAKQRWGARSCPPTASSDPDFCLGQYWDISRTAH